jgi:hypothetical protein
VSELEALMYGIIWTALNGIDGPQETRRFRDTRDIANRAAIACAREAQKYAEREKREIECPDTIAAVRCWDGWSCCVTVGEHTGHGRDRQRTSDGFRAALQKAVDDALKAF